MTHTVQCLCSALSYLSRCLSNTFSGSEPRRPCHFSPPRNTTYLRITLFSVRSDLFNTSLMKASSLSSPSLKYICLLLAAYLLYLLVSQPASSRNDSNMHFVAEKSKKCVKYRLVDLEGHPIYFPAALEQLSDIHSELSAIFIQVFCLRATFHNFDLYHRFSLHATAFEGGGVTGIFL